MYLKILKSKIIIKSDQKFKNSQQTTSLKEIGVLVIRDRLKVFTKVGERG